jgi:hypothetical protein
MSLPPPRMSLAVFPTDDEETLVIQLERDDEVLGEVVLDGAAAEDHIEHVSRVRSQLGDEVPEKLDPGSRLELLVGPNVAVQQTENGVALAIRHPGLGWLGFLLSADQARGLAEALLDSVAPE